MRFKSKRGPKRKKKEKNVFCNLEKDGDLKGMKSHDFHVMIQDILPLCLQGFMSKGCWMLIIYLCHVFKKLCVKIVDRTTMG